MAEELLFCADNLFSTTQYPNHVIVGQEEATGYEAWRVATGRRQTADAWRPTTSNADRYVRATFDQLRGFNFWAIDRNSNLLSNARAGNTSRVQVLGSSDGFTTSRTVSDITLATVPGGTPASALGCVTDEDAILKTVTADAHHAVELNVKAMGSGVTPSIGGLFVGMAWAPTGYVLGFPLQDKGFRLMSEQVASAFGWKGRSRTAKTRAGVLTILPANQAEEDMLEWQVLGLFASGRPAWICQRSATSPWDAILAHVDGEAIELPRTRESPYRNIAIPFEEEQPA